LKLAQGIVCGSWALAFSFDWARQIVEEFELSAIPKAPGWLIGSANIEGNIIPVVDLAVYFSPVNANLQSAVKQRLLVGGINSEGAEDAIAIIFNNLPQQLNYEPQEMTYGSALPAKLRDVCSAVAMDASGQNYVEIDIHKLIAAISEELSLL
jgi:chemotaxis signal transduction protein